MKVLSCVQVFMNLFLMVQSELVLNSEIKTESSNLAEAVAKVTIELWKNTRNIVTPSLLKNFAFDDFKDELFDKTSRSLIPYRQDLFINMKSKK
jgi:hypothetical protein